MFKKLFTLSLGIVLAGTSSGCLMDSIQSEPAIGALANTQWVGEAQGWTLTLDIETDDKDSGVRVASGTLTTNRPDCMAPGPVILTIASGNTELTSTGQGEASQRVIVQLIGDLRPTEFRGSLKIDATASEPTQSSAINAQCDFEDETFVFVRQNPTPPA